MRCNRKTCSKNCEACTERDYDTIRGENFSKGPNRVSPPLTWGRKYVQFPKSCFLIYRNPDDEQRPENLCFCVVYSIVRSLQFPLIPEDCSRNNTARTSCLAVVRPRTEGSESYASLCAVTSRCLWPALTTCHFWGPTSLLEARRRFRCQPRWHTRHLRYTTWA
jgi:hypothetical protein